MFRLIFALASTVPATAMIAAHYMPWRMALGRPLHRLEAYAIGTSAIVSGSVTPLLIADAADVEITPRQAAAIITTSAAAAGIATIAAWLLDWTLDRYHRRLDNELRHARLRDK